MTTPAAPSAAGTIPLEPQEVGPVPQDYLVPGAQTIDLLAVRALMDGSSTLINWVPAVQILGPDGSIMATRIGSTVAAGGSVDVTFAPFLASTTTVKQICSPYDDYIAQLGVEGWWKLDESSGTVAADSSGGGHPLSCTPGAPTWDSVPAPTGTPAPKVANTYSFGAAGGADTYSPDLSGDFTYLIWVYQVGELGTVEAQLGGQDDPVSTFKGWSLRNRGDADAPDRYAEVYIGAFSSVQGIFSDNPLPVNTWYLMGVRHLAGVWNMYVNGVKQAASYSGTYTANATNLVIAQGKQNGAYYAYGMLFGRGLSDAAISNLYSGV